MSTISNQVEAKKHFSIIEKITTNQLLAVVICLYSINTLIMNNLITDDILYQSYSGLMSTDMIGRMLDSKDNFWWVSYLLVLVLIPLKLLLSSACVWGGAIFLGYEIQYSNVWRIFTLAEFLFITYGFIKTLFIHLGEFQTLEAISQYQPFSLYDLFNDNVENYFMYPLSTLNIFEVVYWFILATLLAPILKLNFYRSMVVLSRTYGVGLLLWMSFIVFLTLSSSTI